MSKVLVIGLDAGTFALVRPWAREGHLPNLARLMREGAAGPLRSTLPPCSPAAWSTFATGVNPGRHGILGFHQFGPDSYEPRLMSGAERREPAFWEIAGEHGIRGGVLNLPFTYPPRPYNGFIIGGMMTPRLSARMAEPASAFEDLMAASPRYAIDVDLITAPGTRPEAFLGRALANLDARLDAALALLRKHRPELFCVVFVAADRVSHYFWSYMERDGGGRLAEAVRTTYERLDEAVGRLVDEAGDDTDVLVVSDHGACGLRWGLSVRAALAGAGLLVERRPGLTGCLKAAAVRAFAHRAPSSLRRTVAGLFPAAARGAAGALACGGIDFRRTRAYPTGLTRGVFVNVRGRQPLGTVSPGAEYEAARQEVIAALTALRDPDTGAPALRAVHRREEVWSGPCLEQLPDLVIEPEAGGYAMRTFAAEPHGEVFYALPQATWDALERSGGHHPDGLLIAAGPRVRKANVTDARIIDVPATILALLGCPIPESFEGRVFSEMLTDDVKAAAGAASSARSEPPGRAPAGSDRAAVEKRLRGLGYM